VFVGKLAAVTVGAENVDSGMVVTLGTGASVEAGPAQLLSSAKTTTKYRSDQLRISSALRIFTKSPVGEYT